MRTQNICFVLLCLCTLMGCVAAPKNPTLTEIPLSPTSPLERDDFVLIFDEGKEVTSPVPTAKIEHCWSVTKNLMGFSNPIFSVVKLEGRQSFIVSFLNQKTAENGTQLPTVYISCIAGKGALADLEIIEPSFASNPQITVLNDELILLDVSSQLVCTHQLTDKEKLSAFMREQTPFFQTVSDTLFEKRIYPSKEMENKLAVLANLKPETIGLTAK